MAWFTIFDKRSGRAVSITSVLPETLDADLQVLDHGTLRPNLSVEMWDAAAQAYVPRPSKVFVDRVDDVLNDSRLALSKSLLEATALREVLAEILGRERFRSETAEKRI